MNKRNKFQATVDKLKPDVIGVTESWCNPTIMDSEIALTVVESKTKMFADDTKVYNRVQKNNTTGSDIIQDDLHHLNDWSNKWLLCFNASKCKCMHMGSNTSESTYTPLVEKRSRKTKRKKI